jgi:hypothetical protein
MFRIEQLVVRLRGCDAMSAPGRMNFRKPSIAGGGKRPSCQCTCVTGSVAVGSRRDERDSTGRDSIVSRYQA